MHDATRDKAAGYWLQEDVLPSVSHTERTVPRDELSWQKKKQRPNAREIVVDHGLSMLHGLSDRTGQTKVVYLPLDQQRARQ
jgi:hypothetical protein